MAEDRHDIERFAAAVSADHANLMRRLQSLRAELEGEIERVRADDKRAKYPEEQEPATELADRLQTILERSKEGE